MLSNNNLYVEVPVSLVVQAMMNGWRIPNIQGDAGGLESMIQSQGGIL